jgi:hypothetical protein
MKLNIKNEFGKARSVEHVPLFKYDDIKIYSYQAAEAFNKFFLTLIKNTQIPIVTLFLRNSFPNGSLEMVTIPSTQAEIICTINVLKCRNSSSYGISNKILKLCRHHLSNTLAYNYSKSAT